MKTLGFITIGKQQKQIIVLYLFWIVSNVDAKENKARITNFYSECDIYIIVGNTTRPVPQLYSGWMLS